jgi:protein-disulfide isomerase
MHIRLPLALALVCALAGSVRAADQTVATVGNVTITEQQLEKKVKPQLVEVENQRYEVLSNGLEEMVADALFEQEAKARNVTPQQLEQTEVTAKVPAPTDAEIQQVYDANKSQLGGQTLEQVKPRIVEYLKDQKAEERKQAFVDELKKKYKTTIALKAPVVEVSEAGRPAKGPAKAPITIITWSDYECPFCKRAEPTVEQVLKAYPDKVRLVFRNYPLPFHQHARPAANGALCANAQGKFWEYHDKAFAAQDLSDANLKKLAGEVGLDQKKFDECFDKKQFDAEIQKDIDDGSAAGVSGTPAFFVNGRMISGAQPFEKFKEIIDQELASKGS